MDNANDTNSVSRAQLLHGAMLPLAALLGFMLAEPFGSNLIVLMTVLGVLALPLFMRWYHPMLLATWNAVMIVPFLPGQPPWWMLMAAIGFLVVVINRCVSSRSTFLNGGAVTWSLLGVALVVVVTALMTGGAGIRVLGGSSFGGKRYVNVAAAIIGYFVITSRAIPMNRAWVYVVIFFLGSATSGLSALADAGLTFIRYVVPGGGAWDTGMVGGGGINRIAYMGSLSAALCAVILAKYGVRGLLDFRCWWRLLFYGAALSIGLFSGFRSALIAQVFTFGLLFFIQGLHRTRFLPVLIVVAALCAAGLLAFSAKLPLSVQRSLSFLPINLSPIVLADARDSTEWRTEMWREALPEAKAHFWLGEGFAISPDDLYMASVNAFKGFGIRAEIAATARDYHSGPLSVLIPFGIWGVLAFGWFICASLRYLYRQAMSGPEELRIINQFLFASFVTGTVFFCLVFGDFSYDLLRMVGVVGLSLSLNGGLRQPSQETVEEVPMVLEESA